MKNESKSKLAERKERRGRGKLLCEIIKLSQETGQYSKEHLSKGNPLIKKHNEN